MTRLSCHRFRSNEVRLWLSVMAYNLGNLWRRLVLPKRIDNWSLTSLQQRLVKTGGRLIKHARYYWLVLAESHLTGDCLGAWYGGSVRWRWRPGSGRAMIQRNRADQDVRVGEVFVECAEKKGVRDFELRAQGESPVLQGRKRLPEEEWSSQDQRMAVWLILNEIWKSKMEISDGIFAGHTTLCAGSAGNGEPTFSVSEYSALRAGIFKAWGSIDPMKSGRGAGRRPRAPASSSR